MSNITVQTIQLSGNDAFELAKALFRPTREQISIRSEYMKTINSSVAVTKVPGGYEVDIPELDLTFCEEINIHTKINSLITFTMKAANEFCSLEQMGEMLTKISIAAKDGNYNLLDDENSQWAA